MHENLPQLIQKLLRCECILTRIEISKAIFAVLNSSDDSQIETAIKNHFISRIKVCVVNPGAKQRAMVIETADFYRNNYCDSYRDLQIAA